MTVYAAQAATARGMLQRKGVAVTFTRTTPGVSDPLTDVWTTPATVTVTGYAIRTAADPDRYRALALVETQALTLLFAPTTVGALPDLSYTTTWSGTTYAVRDVSPVAPDGTALGGRVVVTL